MFIKKYNMKEQLLTLEQIYTQSIYKYPEIQLFSLPRRKGNVCGIS